MNDKLYNNRIKNYFNISSKLACFSNSKLFNILNQSKPMHAGIRRTGSREHRTSKGPLHAHVIPESLEACIEAQLQVALAGPKDIQIVLDPRQARVRFVDLDGEG